MKLTPKLRERRIAELTHRLKAANANKKFAESQVVLFDGHAERFREQIRKLREEGEDAA